MWLPAIYPCQAAHVHQEPPATEPESRIRSRNVLNPRDPGRFCTAGLSDFRIGISAFVRISEFLEIWSLSFGIYARPQAARSWLRRRSHLRIMNTFGQPW